MPLAAKRPTQELIDIVGTPRRHLERQYRNVPVPGPQRQRSKPIGRQGDRGILVTCFAGCSREDVLRELRRVRPGRRYSAPAATGPQRPANIERLLGNEHRVRAPWPSASPASPATSFRRHASAFHPRCPYMPKPKTVFEPALLIAVRETRSTRRHSAVFSTKRPPTIRAR